MSEYIPVSSQETAEQRREYWDFAFGLQKVDGLEPSKFLQKLSEEHITGSKTLDEVNTLIKFYYADKSEQNTGRTQRAENREIEADFVSQRIVELLSANGFTFCPQMLDEIHGYIFQDLDPDVYLPGEHKRNNMFKQEQILNGDSVVYGDPSFINRMLEIRFEDEQKAHGQPVGILEEIKRVSSFVAGIWQIHPFVEGNTRTVAAFTAMYLNFLGHSIDNEPFKNKSRYFRNALVRASYRNFEAGIFPDKEPLERFFENIIGGAEHELRSRDLYCSSLFEVPSLLKNVSPTEAFTVKKGGLSGVITNGLERAKDQGGSDSLGVREVAPEH